MDEDFYSKNGLLFKNNLPYICCEDFFEYPVDCIFYNGKPYLPINKIQGLPQNLNFVNGIPYIDINEYKEFQNLKTPRGWYWCEFYGGSKQYRCFLIPENLRRAEFFKEQKYSSLIDDSILPIYKDNWITVRQDPSHAMPGFYIVAPDKAYAATDDLDLILYLNMRFIDNEIKAALCRYCGFKRFMRTNEERWVPYQNVHTWLLPLDDLQEGASILSWNSLEYMIRYSSWRDYKAKIKRINNKMREKLKEECLEFKSQKFSIGLSGLIKKLNFNPNTSLQKHPLNITSENLIYENAGISITQTQNYGLPGFYQIAFNLPSQKMENLINDKIIYLRMRFLDYVTRMIMRKNLNITYAYKLEEQKYSKEKFPPIYIMPIVDIQRYFRIYQFTISDYLVEHGSWDKNSDVIYRNNEIMRRAFSSINLTQNENLLIEYLNDFFENTY